MKPRSTGTANGCEWTSGTSPLLTIRGLCKSYGTNRVLDGVSLTVRPGRIVGLIGENGAGKSTLVKCILGLVPHDGGTIDRRATVAAIHQELSLAGGLSVTANLFLGRERRTRLGTLDHRTMQREAAAIFARLGVEIDPRAEVESLSVAQMQWVAIARALSAEARLLILDEPTALLNRDESTKLFTVLRALRGRGHAMLFISHKLDEVAALCDELIVLRDGVVVSSGTERLEPEEMARRMVGRELEALYPPRAVPQAGTVLRLEGAFGGSFELHVGEILGVAGLAGQGQADLGETLAGFRPLRSGGLTVQGRPVRFRSPRMARAAGIGYLAADRLRDGIWRDFTVAEHVGLGDLPRYTRRGHVQHAAIRSATERFIDTFQIRCRGPAALVGELSGGNQQKVSMAKVLGAEPQVVVFNEPTQGVDVGARQEIYSFIARLAARGVAVLLVSSDMQELIGLCRRVLVMRAGRIAGCVEEDPITEESLIYLATGVHGT
ncbi:MAG: sugar ABC transporter ATP-binding protein [Lentisphaerae bacterium]|jgi:ribose transport system ATP-binding protein|nr:sugar ABC transporter ATP-binding protein [Lentisphaerota bacterium]